MGNVWKKRYVSTKFRDDTFIVDLSPTEKLLFMYFLTNTLTNVAWIYEISIRRISFDTWINKLDIEKIINKFTKAKKIYYIDWFIILENSHKHQNIENTFIKKWVENVLSWLSKVLIEKIGVVRDTEGSSGVLSNLDFNLNLDLDLESNFNLKLSAKEETKLHKEYWKALIVEYLEKFNKRIDKWNECKSCNLTIRNRIRKDWITKNVDDKIKCSADFEKARETYPHTHPSDKEVCIGLWKKHNPSIWLILIEKRLLDVGIKEAKFVSSFENYLKKYTPKNRTVINDSLRQINNIIMDKPYWTEDEKEVRKKQYEMFMNDFWLEYNNEFQKGWKEEHNKLTLKFY